MQVPQPLEGQAKAGLFIVSAALVLWAGCGEEAPWSGDAAAPDSMPGSMIDATPDAPVDAASGADASADASGDASPTPGHDAMPAPDVPRRSPGLGPCGFDPFLPWTPLGEILQLSDAGEDTCVWLQRRNDCDGICKAVPFTLEVMRVGRDGMVVEIDDPGSLSWHSTHHNWDDRGEALSASTRYLLQVSLADTGVHHLAYTLTAFARSSEAELWSVPLTPFEPSGYTSPGYRVAPAADPYEVQ